MKKLSEIKENVLFQHCGQARVKEAIKLLNSLTSDVCYAGKQGLYYGIVNGGVTCCNEGQLNMAKKHYEFKHISVDQFINLFTESEFILPKKWCIKDCKEVAEYATKKHQCMKFIYPDKFLCEDGKHYNFYNPTDYEFNDFTEITLDQFKKYVLKENIVTESAPEPSNLEVIFMIYNKEVARTDFDKLKDFHKFLKENENSSVIIQKKESELDKFNKIVNKIYIQLSDCERNVLYKELKQLFQK